MASALNTAAGAAIRTAARSASASSWTGGSFWQSVPICFQMKAMASSRSTSTPWFARLQMISRYSQKTSGFAQFTSHW